MGAVQAAKREPREIDKPRVRIMENINIRENLRGNIGFQIAKSLITNF